MLKDSELTEVIADLKARNKAIHDAPFKPSDATKSLQNTRGRAILTELESFFNKNSKAYSELKASYTDTSHSSKELSALIRGLYNAESKDALLEFLLTDSRGCVLFNVYLSKHNITKKGVELLSLEDNLTLTKAYYQGEPPTFYRAYLNAIYECISVKEVTLDRFVQTVIAYQKAVARSLPALNSYYDILNVQYVPRTKYKHIGKAVIGKTIATYQLASLEVVESWLNDCSFSELKSLAIFKLVQKYALCDTSLTEIYHYTITKSLTNKEYARQDVFELTKLFALVPQLQTLAQQFFKPASRVLTTQLFEELRAQYVNLVSNSTLYSQAFKAKIVKKLKKITVSVLKDPLRLVFKAPKYSKRSLLKNMTAFLKLNRSILKKRIDKKYRPIEPALHCWTMNACYDPCTNHVTIPALQVQSLVDLVTSDASSQREVLLASIGSVIAHQIAHSIDPHCIKLNSEGVAEVYHPKDLQQFRAVTNAIGEYYRKDLPLPCKRDNQTLAEDFADYQSCVLLYALSRKHQCNQEVFLDAFKVSHYYERRAALNTHLKLTDTHSEGIIRLAKNVLVYNAMVKTKQVPFKVF